MKALRYGTTLFRYWKMATDPRTPRIVRWMVGAGAVYTVIPRKWRPNWLPDLGLGDEAIVLPSLLVLSTYLIPERVKADHAEAALVSDKDRQVLIPGEPKGNS